jgi:hypothetical protein
MSNEEKLTTGETIIKSFTTIKELCDSASALFAKTDAAQAKTDIGTTAFEITEKIQEEIEEIRDLLFEGE